MRAAIKARLADELSAIAGRCYDVHEPSSATVKPYVTVKLAGQQKLSSWLGMKRTYEVALHGETDAAAALDLLANQAVQAIHGVKLSTGTSVPDFTCLYEGLIAPERIDEALQALVHVLQVSVYAVGAVEAGSSSDLWLETLCDWTSTVAGAEWHVYRQHWPQHYSAPAILWRLEQAATTERSAATAEHTKTLVGHILGRTDEERYTMTGTLVERLGSTTKLSVDPVANRYILPGAVTGAYDADGFATGQLNVVFRQSVQKTPPGGPLIGQVHYEGGFG
jgi:hypothetical protein